MHPGVKITGADMLSFIHLQRLTFTDNNGKMYRPTMLKKVNVG